MRGLAITVLVLLGLTPQADVPSKRVISSDECWNEARQGIDSAPGDIRCPGSSAIHYDMGPMAGNYCSDRPAANVLRFKTEDGRTFWLCHTRGDRRTLMLTEPAAHRNFTADISTAQDAFTLVSVGTGHQAVR